MDSNNKISVTIQVTGDCNLACTYCYQHNKKHQKINVQMAKDFIDRLVTNDQDFFQGYIDTSDRAISLEFTGGEGFLYYPIVIELIDYFKESCKKHNRMPFYCHSSFNVGTNGTIFNDDIVALLKRGFAPHLVRNLFLHYWRLFTFTATLIAAEALCFSIC